MKFVPHLAVLAALVAALLTDHISAEQFLIALTGAGLLSVSPSVLKGKDE